MFRVVSHTDPHARVNARTHTETHKDTHTRPNRKQDQINKSYNLMLSNEVHVFFRFSYLLPNFSLILTSFISLYNNILPFVPFDFNTYIQMAKQNWSRLGLNSTEPKNHVYNKYPTLVFGEFHQKSASPFLFLYFSFSCFFFAYIYRIETPFLV